MRVNLNSSLYYATPSIERKWLYLGRSIDALLMKAIVQRDVTIALSPQPGNQVDPFYHPSMLA